MTETNLIHSSTPSRPRRNPALLVATLAALLWCVMAMGESFAAHTKAETEVPASPDQPPPPASPLADPKGALRAYDAALPGGGLKVAEAAYSCATDDERKAAHAMAEVDLATSELQTKSKEKFGPEAVAVVLHAARNATLQDLQEAEAKVDGDHATIIWKTNRPPVPMVKIDGEWRVCVAEVLRNFGKGESLDDFVQTCQDVARQLRRTTEEFACGEYPNLTLLERAVRQRMFGILGEDQ